MKNKKKKMKVEDINNIYVVVITVLIISLIVICVYNNKKIAILETKLEMTKESANKNIRALEDEIYKNAELKAQNKLNYCKE